MSYPGYPNYNLFYGASQNEQAPQNGYDSSRSQVTTSLYPDPSAYSTEARPTSYGSRDYSWPEQNQQPYSNNRPTQGQYAGDSYADAATSQQFSRQRTHASHIESNNRQTDVQPYTSNSSHAPMRPSTQALNELAYASGLESNLDVVPPPRPVQPPQRRHTPNNSASNQSRGHVPKAKTQQASENSAWHSPYSAQKHTDQGNGQNDLALQAAAALQGLPKTSAPNVISPVVNSRPPLPTPNTSKQRAQSPYVVKQKSVRDQREQVSQRPTQQQLAVLGQPKTPRGPIHSTPGRMQQSSGVVQSVPPGVAPIAPPEVAKPVAAHNVNSIANLVTTQDRQPSPAYPSPTESSSSATFINPREVFNPYHRQHERARREAAAAEAVRAKTAPPVPAPAPESVAPTVEPTSEPPDEAQPKNVNQTPSAQPARPKSGTPAATNASSSIQPEESEQAAELRQLLARMKELRGKDAVLFQKVWDEEKGTPAAKPTTASPNTTQRPLPTSASAAAQMNRPAPKPTPTLRQRNPDMPKGFNGYTVVVESNPEGLPDLGRFPAARRVRYAYSSRKEQDSPAYMPQLNAAAMRTSVPPPPAAVPQHGPLIFNPNVPEDSAAPMQRLPAQEEDGSTLWPPEKRHILATQTIMFLKFDPRHEALSITEADIIKMLESNPNYITLCQLIEARGFRFNRAALANCLIERVPFLKKRKPSDEPRDATRAPSQAGASQSPMVTATFNPPPPNHVPPYMSGASIKPEHPNQRFHSGPPMIHGRRSPLPPSASARFHAPLPQVPMPTPGSKEEMARKRGFEDLIDLTNEDDDGYVVPEKRQRVQSPSPDPLALVAESQPSAQVQSSFVSLANPTSQGVLPAIATPLRFDTGVPAAASNVLTQNRPPRVILARKLNKADAARRNFYDPKTVARDVLISVGHHPSERPLNSHLAGLLNNHIELESDLSTFHWEDIDPGGPPPPKSAWFDVPAGPPRFKLRKSEAPDQVSKATAAKSQRSTHDFVLKLNSENPGRPLDRGGRPPKKSEMPRPLASSKLRCSSPGAAQRAADGLRNLAQITSSLAQSSQGRMRVPSDLRHSETAASEVASTSQPAQTPPKKRPDRPPRQSVPLQSPPSSAPPTRRGPGRPPRSTASPQVQILTPSSPSVSSSERAVSVEVRNTQGSFWPSGKPKGRPPGAKNKMQPEDNKASNMSFEIVVPRARAKVETPTLPGEPILPVFKCKWANCGVELHNIPTLRKHIAKLHKPSPEIIEEIGYVCAWKKCSLLRVDADGQREPTPIPTEAEWVDHINEEHIHPLGLRYGDGPSTQHIGKQTQSFETFVSKYLYNPSHFPTDARTVSYTDPQAVASDRSAYLADEHGRTTTHLAHASEKSDVVILADFYTKESAANEEAENAFKDFLRNQGQKPGDMKAAANATINAMEARKEKIGVGIDRGGCTLVNDERRKTFLHNPGISRVVDYDY